MIAAHAAQFRWPAAVSMRAGGLRIVVANPDLKNLAMSRGAWVAGDWAFLIALSVLAYAEGGIPAVGIAGAARVLPAAIVGPWASVVADRYPRPRVLAAIHMAWAVHVLALAIAAYLHLPFVAICTVVAVGSVLSAPFKPTVNSLMPQLVDRPEELTAANAVFGTMDAAGTLLGPLTAGSLLLLLPPHLALLPLAVLYTLAARVSLSIHTGFRPAREGGAERHGRTLPGLVAGFSTLVGEPAPRVIVVLVMGQTTMRGLVNVFVVNAAIGMLGLGESGAGTLFSAIGVGGLAGAVLSFGLRPGRALVPAFALGAGLWGAAVLAIGAWPNPAGAWIFLAALGLGNAIEDVAGTTLLQRLIPDHRLGRAFGAFHGLGGAMVALGSLLAPLLVSLFGLRWAMGISGSLLCLLVLAGWTRLRGLKQPTIPPAAIELLRRQPIFAPLPLIAIEQLARALNSQDIASGEDVVRQGAPGDKFYIVDRGALRVSVDGRQVRTLGPGDAFGETALLREVRRTATVTALTEGHVFWLDGRVFVPAVTGHWGSSQAASTVVDEHLARARPRAMSEDFGR
jgi:MFS family permease